MLKNWYRIFYIMFCVAGAVLYISLWALKPKGVKVDISLACFLLAPLAFFVGTIFYNLFKMFKKTSSLACFVQLLTGITATALFAVGAHAIYKEMGVADIVAGISSQEAGSDIGQWYSQIFISMAYFGQMIVFGLMPLLKGVSKVFGTTPEYKYEKAAPPQKKKVVVHSGPRKPKV